MNSIITFFLFILFFTTTPSLASDIPPSCLVSAFPRSVLKHLEIKPVTVSSETLRTLDAAIKKEEAYTSATEKLLDCQNANFEKMFEFRQAVQRGWNKGLTEAQKRNHPKWQYFQSYLDRKSPAIEFSYRTRKGPLHTELLKLLENSCKDSKDLNCKYLEAIPIYLGEQDWNRYKVFTEICDKKESIEINDECSSEAREIAKLILPHFRVSQIMKQKENDLSNSTDELVNKKYCEESFALFNKTRSEFLKIEAEISEKLNATFQQGGPSLYGSFSQIKKSIRSTSSYRITVDESSKKSALNALEAEIKILDSKINLSKEDSLRAERHSKLKSELEAINTNLSNARDLVGSFRDKVIKNLNEDKRKIENEMRNIESKIGSQNPLESRDDLINKMFELRHLSDTIEGGRPINYLWDRKDKTFLTSVNGLEPISSGACAPKTSNPYPADSLR